MQNLRTDALRVRPEKDPIVYISPPPTWQSKDAFARLLLFCSPVDDRGLTQQHFTQI